MIIADLGGEGLVVDAEGRAIGAISDRTCWVDRVQSTRGKKIIELPRESRDRIDLWIEAGYNGGPIPPFGRARFKDAFVAERRDDIKDLYYDYLLLVFASAACEDSARRGAIDRALSAAWAALRSWDEGSVAKARSILAPALAGGGEGGKPAYGPAPDFTAVGHSHLDLAWLWPLRETKRKAARTFTNALANIERYPGYVYGASQPQQFAWIKAERPELWLRIVEAVREGRIEPQGGMWVEADTNLPSGESLVRQCLYGKRFFREEFGQDMRICWLPDVFGYNANLPQILRKSGIEYFMTIKLSWNEVNDFPHRSFTWRGIDGSEVLAHMPPEGDYNSGGTPLCVKRAVEGFPEKDILDRGLILFGAGDGGGGPGEAHLELVSRQADLAGFPHLGFGKAVDFFDELKIQAPRLPTWEGELYLEKHQGTYTTQGRNKKANRRTETLLHEVECLSAAAWLRGAAYPKGALERIWKELLLYQFHDIIPGSGIGRVYDESLARYAQLERELEALAEAALGALSLGRAPTTGGPESGPRFANLAPFPRSSYLRTGPTWSRLEAPAYSIAEAFPAPGPFPLGAGEDYIENDLLKVCFARDGSISSIVDKKRGIETVAGWANRLVIYADPWRFFNAWDISPSYIRLPKTRLRAVGKETFIDGPRVVRKNRYRHGRTSLVQEVILEAGSPLVEFDTVCDWHENLRMLRADFAPAVWADKVRCEIQFGSFDRSTREEDSVEKAQFEICAHRWIDVSKEGSGVSLINDCKYGHRAKRGVLSLNLLRSPIYPDPKADRGRHSFRYAWYPHAGEAETGGTIRQASLFNIAPRPAGGALLPPMAVIGASNVIIDTIKKAEELEALVLRIYESAGKETVTTLDLGFDHAEVFETDLLEGFDGGKRRPVELSRLSFSPFEIKTLLVRVPGRGPTSGRGGSSIP